MDARPAVFLTDRTDDELAAMAQLGDRHGQAVLIERYRRFARSKGRSYYLVGGDADDVEQEALIGLYKAIRDYRVDRQASFRAFAELCVTRQVITAVKTATRRKHQPLNRSVPIAAARTDEQSDGTFDEPIDLRIAVDPVEQVLSAERLATIRHAMLRLLSPFEIAVLAGHVEGRTYQEISDELGRHVKAVDNALQRIKRKLDGHLQLEDADIDLTGGTLATAV
jgi:RNA polymerase sporulation-specific sigma factor